MKRVPIIALLFVLVAATLSAAAGPVTINLEWDEVPGADAGYRFYAKDSSGRLTEIGTAAAGTTSTTLQVSELPKGRYSIHAASLVRLGWESDLSLAATYVLDGSVAYLTKPGASSLRLR